MENEQHQEQQQDQPTGTIFDQIPSDFGGAPPETKEKKDDATPPDPPEREEAKPADGSLDDLLGDGENGKPTKKPSDYARERRERKQQRQEILEKAPVLEEENRTLKARVEEMEAKLKEREESTALGGEEVRTLREQLEAERKRYVSTYAPRVDPYEDEEVKQYVGLVDDALRTNLPRFALGKDGQRKRLDISLIKREPERKAAIDGAVVSYALAAESGDQQAMDKAVGVFASALGNLDVDDDEIRESLDSALSRASDPVMKGMRRFQQVKESAAEIAMQRRAEQIADTERRLLAAFQLDPDAVDAKLEENPAHPWANFGKLLESVPDDVFGQIEAEVRKDAAVLGAMSYQPPPLPENATREQIAEHESLVRAGADRALSAARYLAVGRMMIDGGILAHLRSKAAEYEARKEELAGAVAIPSGGSSDKKPDKGAGGMWDSVPSTYRRG